MAGDKKRSKTIVFLHPDLGIGGAERLVVDAAVGLQKRGHRVVIFTSHCDPAHCFDEARDGTLDVRVRGDTVVPTNLLGRFAILCAILRQLHLILHIALFTSELRDLSPDAFFVDQLSAGLPLLTWLSATTTPIFFYCHFPDLLLAQGRARLWKRLYRVPFDRLEGWSMAFADAVAVNSAFTQSIVSQTWPALARSKILHVVYPCIDTSTSTSISFSFSPPSGPDNDNNNNNNKVVEPLPWTSDGIILSINRFERKKDVALALRAFALLAPRQRKRARLILAGGYDNRVAENVSYHAELVALADELGLKNATAKTLPSALSNEEEGVQVLFLLSVPNVLKEMLLRSARLLVYTPSNEHFGIVPLEAMLRGVPVLAADSGGPRETVVEGVTGWLRDPGQPRAWCEVMDRVLNEMGEEELKKMGRAGVERVKGRFAEAQMAERLEGIFEGMEKKKGLRRSGVSGLVVLVAAAAVVGALIAVMQAGRIGR
ncbi:glycosyltransferase family 4 protein [Chaetomium strumarium]|uniref:Alpha-1,3/1,6-mannosyltransferase ALG2 n=1 Tax=Chaetomium strumarium TaxID=1170767 RepID=A0AAJ0GQ29_9PEZI|nr:glycosyltransferase family 4 protein [Chaetomium strumarium]